MTAQVGSIVIGLAAVIGATVAVCLGHIDAPTYIALVGPLGGASVGVGAHAAGAALAKGS